MTTAAGPATVSTLREAEQFAAAGVRDLLYAVGIGPDKLSRVLALREAGIDLSIVLDSVDQAHAVAAACKDSKTRIPVLIEIDADDQRAGLRADDPRVSEIGRLLVQGCAELRGVMTHSGGSYSKAGADALCAAAEAERSAAVRRCGASPRGLTVRRGQRGIDTDGAFCARSLRRDRSTRRRIRVF